MAYGLVNSNQIIKYLNNPNLQRYSNFVYEIIENSYVKIYCRLNTLNTPLLLDLAQLDLIKKLNCTLYCKVNSKTNTYLIKNNGKLVTLNSVIFDLNLSEKYGLNNYCYFFNNGNTNDFRSSNLQYLVPKFLTRKNNFMTEPKGNGLYHIKIQFKKKAFYLSAKTKEELEEKVETYRNTVFDEYKIPLKLISL